MERGGGPLGEKTRVKRPEESGQRGGSPSHRFSLDLHPLSTDKPHTKCSPRCSGILKVVRRQDCAGNRCLVSLRYRVMKKTYKNRKSYTEKGQLRSCPSRRGREGKMTHSLYFLPRVATLRETKKGRTENCVKRRGSRSDTERGLYPKKEEG